MTDLDATVRAVCHLPPQERQDRIRVIITAAKIGDRYRKKLGKVHPVYGNGTLASASGGAQKPARFCDAHYRACLRDLLDHLDAPALHQSA